MTTRPMTLNRLRALVGNGRLFSCTFTKRSDGSERRMVARLGVAKGLKGGAPAYDASSRDLLTVWDMSAGGYRSIPVEGVRRLKCGGRTYEVRHG